MRAVRSVVVGALAATSLLAAPAGATVTLRGTVVDRPVVRGTHVVVPVLLSTASARTAHTGLAKVVVPRAGLRSAAGRLQPLALRIGDRVTATVGRAGARPSTRRLRVVRRSAAPSFARLDTRRASLSDAVQQALDLVGKAPATQVPGGTLAADPDTQRAQLLAVRTRLNLLIDDLRAGADQADATVAAITATRPADPAARAVAERRQGPALAALTADAAGARAAAKLLDDAVAGLDEAINGIGDPSAAPLPVGGVSTVSDLLYTVLDILRGLG